MKTTAEIQITTTDCDGRNTYTAMLAMTPEELYSPFGEVKFRERIIMLFMFVNAEKQTIEITNDGEEDSVYMLREYDEGYSEVRIYFHEEGN